MEKIITIFNFLILSIVMLPQLILAASLDNPLIFNGENAIADLIIAVINIFRIVVVPIVVFFVIYAGFNFVIGRGNPESINKAKTALIYALIGAVIIAGAEAIGLIVKNTANEFGS